MFFGIDGTGKFFNTYSSSYFSIFKQLGQREQRHTAVKLLGERVRRKFTKIGVSGAFIRGSIIYYGLDCRNHTESVVLEKIDKGFLSLF